MGTPGYQLLLRLFLTSFILLGLTPRVPWAQDANTLPGPLSLQPSKGSSSADIDSLRKQVDLLQERLNLLIDHNEEVVDELDKRTLESMEREASLRNELDATREMLDADRRDNVYRRAHLNELVNTFRNHESPIWIGGTLNGAYTDLEHRNSTFGAETFSPHFYALLNESFLFETNPELTAGGNFDLESAQLDYFMHDNLTLVFGRFYAPIGFMNERLHTTWIYKTPDKPLMFQQVFPSTTSLQGMQFRGARYIADTPVKAEYNFFIANGYSADDDVNDVLVAADLRDMDHLGADVNNDKAFGGRLGFQVPLVGLIGGVSYMANGAYDRGNQYGLDLLDIDLSWRKGNWDAVFEMAQVHQATPAAPIRRSGMYAQLAYRDFASRHAILEKLEYVLRWENTDFRGVAPSAARSLNALDRDRMSVGVNFYPYPTLIYKVHFTFDQEATQRSTEGLYVNIAYGF